MKVRRLVGVLGALVALFAVVCVVRASRLSRTASMQLRPIPRSRTRRSPPTGFAAALRFPTISTQDSASFNAAPFLELHAWLATAFPNIIAPPDERSRRELQPALHLDRIRHDARPDPAHGPPRRRPGGRQEPSPAGNTPPFAGDIADGFVWGRGTLDDKASVIAILEAVEWLVGQGFEPRRTVYLAFGHDEELGGFSGAASLAAILKERAGKLAFLVDEGGVIAEGLMPGVDRPIALIGVVEKGSIGVHLTVERTGGHSSMPPRNTAVGVLSRAITRLEDNPMPARLTPVVEEMLLRLAPEMPFVARIPLANLWAFRPVMVRGASAESPDSTPRCGQLPPPPWSAAARRKTFCQLSPGGSLISGSCRGTRRRWCWIMFAGS